MKINAQTADKILDTLTKILELLLKIINTVDGWIEEEEESK